MPLRTTDMDEIEIISENLVAAEGLLAEGWALRYAHLREMSALFLGGKDRLPRRSEPLSEGCRTLIGLVKAKREERGRSDVEKAEFERLSAELDLHSRLMLAREWASVADPLPLPDCRAEQGNFTVAHFGNLYADRALEAFSKALGGASVLPSEDYASACEEVSEGSTDFCILPIESARDGIMDRFEQMIDRYSLFILMVCSVRLSEDEWIRYALLASAPCRLNREATVADCLQLRISTEGEALWEVLLAAELLGAKLIDCRLSGGRSDRAAAYRLTFSAADRSRSELIAYLELGYSGYLLTGAYRQLGDLLLEEQTAER